MYFHTGVTQYVYVRLFQRMDSPKQGGHLMVFTQCSILNRDSPDLDNNRSPFVRQRTEIVELHLGREHPFWGCSTDLHYLGLSTDLKTVSCHLLSWLTL